jgi:hypothetical protein
MATVEPVPQPTLAERRPFGFAAAMNSVAPKTTPAPKIATEDNVALATGTGCRVQSASYGGKKALLVRSEKATQVHYTVLTVLEGFERSMLDNYVKAHAPGGTSVGEFASRDAALAKAKELCPKAAVAPREGASAG